jgi:Kef-type K+ transport system membrane component KefB
VFNERFRLKWVWKLAEPFLFPLIGASVSFSDIKPSTLLTALCLVFLSISVKMSAAYYSCMAAGLSSDEQIFASGIWTGKASVQVFLKVVSIVSV